HVGGHILKSALGVPETGNSVSVSTQYPCGTCGGPSTSDACQIHIKSGKADSNCPSAYSFLISAASQFRETRPCTNVPIKCLLLGCTQIHWKYNFIQHLDNQHPSWRNLLSSSFLPQIQISRAEQRALGITDSKI
ncbi:hypothetical protein B0H13DRAFT_1510739, partial [Mycena leptocephala]